MTGDGRRGRQTAALADLFAQHAERLTGALVAAGFPDAADAVQEAFVQAVVHWRKVGVYDDPVQWIRRVAVNRAINRSRTRFRQQRVANRLAAEPTSVLEPAEPHDDLTDAIGALPAQQRLAVSLFYFADLPVADVAHAMGISDGAVKYHLHAARQSIAGALEVHDEMG